MKTKLKEYLNKLNALTIQIKASPTYQKLIERTQQYALLVRLDRPIGIYLLLWPTLWSLWIASEGKPNLLVLFVFIMGTILMRSAGCAMNDFADRKIDIHVERTKNRPIAMGNVSPREAILVAACLAIVAFLLVLLMNDLTIQLSFVTVFLAAIYPFSKRYTYMPQMFLGAAFGWSVPMAFAAQTGEIPVVAWLIFLTTVLWAMAYDTMYAMIDRDDDIKLGVKSTAILFGEADVALIMLLQAMVLTSLGLAGYQLALSIWYYIGLGVATTLIIYQYFLIRHREKENCFKAFLNNNYVGMAIFAGLVAHYISILFDNN